jgi:hypothetical protein
MKTAFYALILSSLLTASIAFSADTISPEDAINHTSCNVDFLIFPIHTTFQSVINTVQIR